MPRLASILSGIIMLSSATFDGYAAEYSSLLVRAQTSIFPKIIMLDENVADKVLGNSIQLHVLYQPGDKGQAESVKQSIEDNYGNKIGQYDFHVRLIDASKIVDEVPTAFYLLNLNADIKKTISQIAIKNKRISFSYDHKDLTNDALISLQLKEKVYIYLSKKQLNAYDIRFQSVFYNIVKVVE